MKKWFKPAFVVTFLIVASVIWFQGYSVMDASDGREASPKFQSVQKLDKLKQKSPELQTAPNGGKFKVWKDGTDRIISLNEIPTADDITTLTKDQFGSDVVNLEPLTLEDGTKAIYAVYEAESKNKNKKIRYSELMWSKKVDENIYYTHKMTFTSGFNKEEIVQLVNSAVYAVEEPLQVPEADANKSKMQKNEK